jgi:MoxR-like ATPase
MIEAMQEKQVTIGKTTFALPKPFFVMATENPLEQEGVYPLPEAQVDRFLFKVIFGYPDEESEKKVMEENLTFRRFEDLDINVVLSPQKILELQKLVHMIYLSPRVKDYIMAIVKKTREKDFDYGKYISLGSSPRAGIALYIAAKAQALIKGRTYVVPEDIKDVAKEILRHRIILTYRARAENVNTDKIVDEIIRLVK